MAKLFTIEVRDGSGKLVTVRQTRTEEEANRLKKAYESQSKGVRVTIKNSSSFQPSDMARIYRFNGDQFVVDTDKGVVFRGTREQCEQYAEKHFDYIRYSNSFQNGQTQALQEIQNRAAMVGVRLKNEMGTKEAMRATANDHMTRELKECFVVWDEKLKKVVTIPK
jgi:hypothetical protein